jgi:hypothetical protein
MSGTLNLLWCEKMIWGYNVLHVPLDSVALLVEAALHDPSDKVQDKMVMTFASHSPDARISEALQQMVEQEANSQIRQKAVRALRYHLLRSAASIIEP